MTNSNHRMDRRPDQSHLVLLELNEINFDVAARYVERLNLKNLKRLLDGRRIRTCAEDDYNLLEPWIQWVSVHSGLTAHDHRVQRLGDIVGSGVPQLFEQLETEGLTVGCISAMNAENRLRSPAYFVPDPWTRTPSDGSFFSRALTEAVSQSVNDNAQGRITAASAVKLLLALMRFAQPMHYGAYARLFRGRHGAPWRKALFLDLLLHDVHITLQRKRRPNFSTLFVNAGAHIQHHYFFNADVGAPGPLRNPAWYVSQDADPVGEMLVVYDLIVGEYLDDPSTDLIVATGLTQQPYDRAKFYYRLKDHSAFLTAAGIRYRSVQPRMTRDFLIECDTSLEAEEATRQLTSIRVAGSGTALFGEVDNRGTSVFATLTYPEEVTSDLTVELPSGPMRLSPHVVFVALKNGMHDGRGFAFFKGRVEAHSPRDGDHVGRIFHSVRHYFGLAA